MASDPKYELFHEINSREITVEKLGNDSRTSHFMSVIPSLLL